MSSHAVPETVPLAFKALPPFPQVAMRLVEALSQEDAFLKQVAELLRMDQAFAAEILKLANSAWFGLRSRVDSLTHAIVLVGTAKVKSLTVTVALHRFAKGALRHAALKRCWHQSLATACLAERMAPAFGLERDRAYTAGLMREIGRLALLVAHPAECANLIEAAAERSTDMLDVERELFGIDHRQAGVWVAREWKFPPELREVIAEQEYVWIREPVGLPALAQLASHLADALGFQAYRPHLPWTVEDVLAYLPAHAQAGFPPPDELAALIRDKMAALGG